MQANKKKTKHNLLMYFLVGVLIFFTVKFRKTVSELLNYGDFEEKKNTTKKVQEAAKDNNVSTDDVILTTDWKNIRYFKPSEFDSSDSKGSGINMKIEFVAFLDELRHLVGVPFKIGAGFRTPEKNKSITHNGKQYSAKNSPHMHGIAADISFDDYETAKKVFEYALQLRNKILPDWRLGLGFYASKRHSNAYFIHLDNRKHRFMGYDVMWFSDRYNIGQYRNVPKPQQSEINAIFKANKR